MCMPRPALPAFARRRGMINQAMRLGTRSALMYYHAGMIAYRLGDCAAAVYDLDQALRLNSHFSFLYADQAGRLLADLRGGQMPTLSAADRTGD